MNIVTHNNVIEQPQATLEDIALSYAKRGWRVFPLYEIQDGKCTCPDPACSEPVEGKPGKFKGSPGKHPRTGDGFKSATTNENTIRRWWTRWPNANIGIATGEGLHVVDEDSAKGGRIEDIGGPFETLTVRTGSGGRHFYFKRDINLSNSDNFLSKAIDTRGDGGYVVASGSNHISGGTYEWINDLEPALLPIPIVERLKTREKKKERKESTAEDVYSEARNSHLTRIAGTLRAQGLSVDEVRDAILIINQSRYGEGKHPDGPLDEAEIERTLLRSTEKWEQGKVITPLPQPDRNYGETDTGKRIFKTLSMDDIDHLPDIEWLLQKVLQKGTVSLWYGDANTGKTFLGLDVTLHIAHGWAWMGRKVIQGTILYIYGEGSLGLKPRLNAFKKHHNIGNTDQIRFIAHPVNMLNDQQTICDTIESFPEIPDVVVVDTFGMCFPDTQENVANEVGKALDVASHIKLTYGSHVIIVHHTGKNGDFRGSSAFRGRVDTMIEVSSDGPESPIRIHCNKQRDGGYFEDIWVKLEKVELGWNEKYQEYDTSCVVVGAEPEERNTHLPHKQAQLVSILKAKGELTSTEWEQEATQQFNFSHNMFTEALRELKKKGAMEREGEFKGAKYRLVGLVESYGLSTKPNQYSDGLITKPNPNQPNPTNATSASQARISKMRNPSLSDDVEPEHIPSWPPERDAFLPDAI